MTAMRYVTIWCDGKMPPAGVDCGQYVEGDDASDARANARGWLTSLPGGRDLCPAHHEQRAAATRWGVTADPTNPPGVTR